MKLSEQGTDLLIEREGSRNDAYKDSVGIWTCGVGHVGPEVVEGVHWDDAKVREVFAKDIAFFEAAVNGYVTVPLTQNQFDALVSFTFNVGMSAFHQSTMLKLLNTGNADQVPAQFDRWHIPPEITSRRNGEREQFKGTQFKARIP